MLVSDGQIIITIPFIAVLISPLSDLITTYCNKVSFHCVVRGRLCQRHVQNVSGE